MFKKLKELLEAGRINEELAKEIDNEISKALKERNDENAKLRLENKELRESVQKEREALKTEYEAKLKEAKESGKAELEKEFSKKLAEVESRAKELELKTKEANLKALMTTTLSNFDVIDIDVASSYIKNFVIENENGFSIKVGEEVLSFENGVDKILSERSFLLRPKGNGGSGAGKDSANFAQTSFTARLLSKKG